MYRQVHGYNTCNSSRFYIRAVASMRQDEAVASSWFWPIFFFLKKRLIEKIIPRKMYIILELTSKKMLPKTSPNYLHYKIHKCWLLSWIHVIVIIRVPTFECFKMQMVVNLAQVSLSNRKENFYTCPRLTFLKKNATENAYKSISEPLDFKIFWGGGFPQTPLAAHAFGTQNLPRLVLKSGYSPVHSFLFC